MIRVLVPSILLSTLLLGGCATSSFDRHFEMARYDELGRIFEGDSTLHRDERSLFRAGLAYALPTSSIYHPDRAREIFELLLKEHPRSSYREQAEFMDTLLGEIQRLSATNAEQESRGTALRERTDKAERQLEWLEALLEEERKETERYRELSRRQAAELETTRGRLKALEAELERLKEIDLKERRRSGKEPARR